MSTSDLYTHIDTHTYTYTQTHTLIAQNSHFHSTKIHCSATVTTQYFILVEAVVKTVVS